MVSTACLFCLEYKLPFSARSLALSLSLFIQRDKSVSLLALEIQSSIHFHHSQRLHLVNGLTTVIHSPATLKVHSAGKRLDLLCLQNCLHSSLLRDFGPYWRDSVTQLLQICKLHVYDANLPFHNVPKELCWIETWGLGAVGVQWTHCVVLQTSLRPCELCDVVHCPAGSSHQKMVHCGPKGMDVVRSNTRVDCAI